MQVQLTTFQADAFPVVVRVDPDFTMNTELPAGALETRARSGRVNTFRVPKDRDHHRANRRLLQPKGGVIGASCLSIIGMIEPGRTVRLYRQIH